MRSQAYLAAHQGREAAAEFQKIIDHRGIVLNGPAAYQHFLTLWKDADPNIPTLRQAKAEYKKITATASTSASESGRETNHPGVDWFGQH